MAKVREVRHIPGGGFSAYRKEVRVRKLENGEEPPAESSSVPNDTPEHDWRQAEEGE